MPKLAISTPDAGLRCYLAISGGIAVEPELGSRSRDVLSGIGPALLKPGEWFDDPAHQLSVRWTVTAESNRVGLRLDGIPLRRKEDGELPSEGVLTGAIQVPPSGLPVVFLADHPTTGGYPVIGVVVPNALPALAQARPGTTVRFRPQA